MRVVGWEWNILRFSLVNVINQIRWSKLITCMEFPCPRCDKHCMLRTRRCWSMEGRDFDNILRTTTATPTPSSAPQHILHISSDNYIFVAREHTPPTLRQMPSPTDHAVATHWTRTITQFWSQKQGELSLLSRTKFPFLSPGCCKSITSQSQISGPARFATRTQMFYWQCLSREWNWKDLCSHSITLPSFS